MSRISPRNRTATLIGGAVGLVAVLLLRASTAGPWTVLHRLNATDMLPPLWLLGVLWIGFFIILGVAAGWILSVSPGGSCEVAAWRGCTFLSLSAMLAFAWYALLFAKFSLLVAWLCLPAALVLAVLCTLSWWQIHTVAALVPLAHALWLLTLFLWQGAVMLRA